MKLYASVQKENIHARTKLRGTERGAKWGWGGRYGSGARRFTLLILCPAAYVRTAITNMHVET